MADSYTDGDILLDAFEATIASQSYIFNNASVSIPSVSAERNDTDGTLAAKRNLKDTGRINGTAEIQIDVSAKNQELINETFLIPAAAHPDGVETRYVIEDESQSTVSNESRVRSITYRRTITQPA